MPRNDELVNNHDNKTAAYIRKYYNIPADNKIILYAPTYRKGKRNEATDYNLDVRGIVEAAKERFGGEWTILYRMHYFIKKRLPAAYYRCHRLWRYAGSPSCRRYFDYRLLFECMGLFPVKTSMFPVYHRFGRIFRDTRLLRGCARLAIPTC